MPGEDLNDLRSKYEGAVANEINRVGQDVKNLTSKVDEMKLTLAQINLLELRTDVRKISETLTRYDLKDLWEKVEDHDKQITRAIAIIVFVQIIIGLAATLSRLFWS